MLAITLLLILHSLAFAQTPLPNPVTKPLIESLWNFGRMGRCVLQYSPICLHMVVVGLLIAFSSLAFAQTIRPKPAVNALWNLEEISECVLHYNPLVYNNYGCWCGVGGSHEPVDEIDKCCMLHDKCYDAAVDAKYCFDVAWEYIDGYKWKCDNGTATCTEKQTACKMALCACDSAVVQCWSKLPKPLKKKKCNHIRKLSLPYGFQH